SKLAQTVGITLKLLADPARQVHSFGFLARQTRLLIGCTFCQNDSHAHACDQEDRTERHSAYCADGMPLGPQPQPSREGGWAIVQRLCADCAFQINREVEGRWVPFIWRR